MTTPDDRHEDEAALSPGGHCSALGLTAVSDGKPGNPQPSATPKQDPADGAIPPNRFFEGLLYVLPPSILVWLIITWLISLF